MITGGRAARWLLRSESAHYHVAGGCAVFDGRMFFRSDFVNMNVGSFSIMPMANGMTTGVPVRCTTVVQPQPVGFRCQRGGWLAQRHLSWDIGTTPMGFNVVDVVGGTVTAMISGRWVTPLTPTVGPLQFFACLWRAKRLPEQYREKWGGVRADGVGLSLSYDKGEETASGHRLVATS